MLDRRQCARVGGGDAEEGGQVAVDLDVPLGLLAAQDVAPRAPHLKEELISTIHTQSDNRV